MRENNLSKNSSTKTKDGNPFESVTALLSEIVGGLALSVLNLALGGGVLSRLFQRLHER